MDEQTLKARVIVQDILLQAFSQYVPLEVFGNASGAMNAAVAKLDGSGDAGDAALAAVIRTEWNRICLQLAK